MSEYGGDPAFSLEKRLLPDRILRLQISLVELCHFESDVYQKLVKIIEKQSKNVKVAFYLIMHEKEPSLEAEMVVVLEKLLDKVSAQNSRLATGDGNNFNSRVVDITKHKK